MALVGETSHLRDFCVDCGPEFGVKYVGHGARLGRRSDGGHRRILRAFEEGSNALAHTDAHRCGSAHVRVGQDRSYPSPVARGDGHDAEPERHSQKKEHQTRIPGGIARRTPTQPSRQH